MKKSGKIYVVTHKEYTISDLLLKKGYELISVGNANQSNNLGVKDSSLENITSKNPNFCELTALYWIWNNDVDSKYKGLVHYRRYLTTNAFNDSEKYYLDMKDVEHDIESEKYEIIVPKMQYFTRTASENYLRCGYVKDIQTTRNVVLEKYPEYIEYFDDVFNGNRSYLTNIMISKAEIFDTYCNWLFDILFEVENRTDLTGYSVQEARIYGYLSERLLTVWILKNKLKVKEYDFINTDEPKNIPYYVKQFAINIRVYQTSKTIFWKLKKYLKSKC